MKLNLNHILENARPRLRYRHGAGVLLYCKDTGRFLLQIRSANTSNPLKYDYFGGGVDAGETPRLAAAREMSEEGGIEIDPEDLHKLCVFNSIPENGSGGGYSVFLAVTDQEVEPDVKPDEVDGWEWLSPEEMHGKPLLDRVYGVLGHPEVIERLRSLI